MDWKVSLDKYLTSEPFDGFDNFCEMIIGNHISDCFYQQNEDWLYSEQCDKWLNKLYKKDIALSYCAMIIERGFKIYIKKP
jgi:hypothetical protein